MARQVLVIAPHPDDESIGCGGTISLEHLRGNSVSVVFLSSGERGLHHLPAEVATATREAEAEAAAGVLGITGLDFLRLPDGALLGQIGEGARRLRRVLGVRSPDRIYLPHPYESHSDHQAALPMLRRALGRVRAGGPELRGYEVWSPMGWHDVVEDISPVMARKLRAIRCHRTQIVAPYRYDLAALGLSRYRGLTTIQARYAEVFQSIPRSAMAESAGAVMRHLRNAPHLRPYRRPFGWLRARLRRSRGR